MKKYLSGFLVFVMVFGMFSFTPSRASAATTSTLNVIANGTYTAWTGSKVDVDETSNFNCSATDSVISGVGNTRQSFTLDLSSIPDGSTITSVDVTTHDRSGVFNNGGTYRTFTRLNGVNTDNGVNLTSANLPVIPLTTCSSAKTQTINVADTVKSGTTTLEIGVLKIGTGNIVRVGAIEAVVTYTLPTPTTTVVVTGNTAAGENQPGWMFNRDLSTSTPFTFNTNAASIGTGSLNVLPIGSNPSDKMVAENFLNTPISDINSISYDFKIGAGGADTQEEQFYMNVYANFGVSDDLKYYDCRYNVVPTIGSTGGFTTVTFDPTMSYPVTTRAGGNASPFTCPSVPADMNTLSAGSNIRAFALNLGDTSTSDVGLDGFFDKVIVNTDSLITTYDFEPAPLPAFVKVTIAKYINGMVATAENTNNTSFPMVASWSAENIGTGSGNYTLSSTGFNNPNPYQATTSDMTTGADYSTYEDAATSCTTESPYVLSGYSIGNTLEEAVAGTKSLTVPAFTDLTSDKFIIVWNRTCVPLPVHVSPADNSTRTTAEQSLIDWSDVVNWALPISYIYQASNGMDTNIDGSFTTPVYTSVPLSTSEIPTPGTPEGVYYWHVRALDSAMNSSSWTTPWKITIDNTPEPMCAEDATTTVVSNTMTQVDEHDALAIEPHPAYVSIEGATWIWSDASALDGDNVLSASIGTKVFSKNFTITGTPLDSTLEVAADNTYTVVVNGTTLDTLTSGTDSDNFTSVDSWTVPASILVSGTNIITFTVTNQSKPEGYTGVNPAGLLYKLTIHQNECVTPEPTQVKVHVLKYLKGVESLSQVSNESSITPFPMTASWNASNLGGEGTGNYVLGNYHGQETLKYAADTTAMTAPVVSYTTYERTSVEENDVAYVLPVGAQCMPNTYRLVGYKSGGSLNSALLMETSSVAPVLTNFTTDQYIIVVNEDCDDVIAQEVATIIVRKVVVNDEGGTKNATDFSFTVTGQEGSTPFLDTDEDENSLTGQNTVTVQPGTYTITENLADGYYQISAEGCQNVTIAAGETKVCTFTNYDYVVPTPGSGGNGLGGGAPQVLGASTEAPVEEKKEAGQVLGAGTTMCSTIYLNDYLFFGRKNNSEQVKLLQAFLNEHLGLTLTVDGVYGKTTRDAVKAFQVKYLDEVLIPWKPFGLKSEKGTGNVYKTTKRKINLIKCADLNLPIPQLP